ncbi:serine/threonine-protein phosphatase BSL3-like [Magnolia sinica]|uniref:serine/threonine-protein phosphatase BSL3-like n=1 Tax=Magnolia sinica TaxID=86752 RepID=UPI00265AB165|nr:serine/threonine-protein phosphatase BSL3-like isoform X2 [Magnolia sinica]XP_058089271.1 serine/threonine-protein phosphatase BSL3-like [Magnolia sinica]
MINFPNTRYNVSTVSQRWRLDGVLLDDLLVAEDLAAAETTSAASHAAAAAAATNVQAGRLPARYTFVDERTRQEIPKVGVDGAVVLGSLVAPPINGICTPI